MKTEPQYGEPKFEGFSFAIEKGIRPQKVKAPNHHKKVYHRQIVNSMVPGDSIIVPTQEIFKFAGSMNSRGFSYSYERLDKTKARIWMLPKDWCANLSTVTIVDNAVLEEVRSALSLALGWSNESLDINQVRAVSQALSKLSPEKK